MYHSQSGSFSTRSSTKNPLASSKNRNNGESLDRHAQYASNPMATTRSSIHPSEKASTLGSPRTGPEKSDSVPYFGHHEGKTLNTKRSNVTIKSTLDSNYQSEPFGRKSHESHLSHLEGSTSRRGLEFSSRGIHNSHHTRSIDMNSNKDLKQSNSYINAMKALQTRVKELEDERKRERLELEERHREEIQAAQRNFEEERKTFHDLENSLKNRLKLLEDELRERERAFEDLQNENERLRKAGYDLETERVAEIQKIAAEKKRLKDQYMELEQKYHEILTINEDLKGRMMRADFAVQDKDNELHDLREKLDSVEREKATMNMQAEQRFKDLVSRQKQEEERRKDLETEHNEEIRRRTTREENVEREGSKIRTRLRDLEEHNEILEKKLRDRETDFADKASYILKLKDEVENLYRELQKSKETNQRTHLYAQDMAQMNQRLINGLIEKGQPIPRDYDINFVSSPRVVTKESYATRINTSPQADDILGGRRRTREDLDISDNRSDNRSKYRSPRGGEEKRNWTVGSPSQRSVVVREFDYSTKGPKLNDEDLFMSERRVTTVEEKKSPRGILLNSGSKSMNAGGRRGTENSGTKVKFVTKRDDRRETAVDKLELEGVLKDIIVIQKDMLEWNREYQGLINETMSLPKESNEYRNRKKRMEELANWLQDKNFHLLNLKKKEEELIIKLKDS